MASLGDSDLEEQHDELLVLSSIYDDDDIFIAGEDNNGGQFNCKLQIPQPFFLQLNGQAQLKGVKNVQDDEGHTLFPVKHLPPIVLNFQYPPNYPSCLAPQFTLSCKWLSVHQLSKLCHKLDEIWEENKGGVVVFLWTQFLSEETLDILSIDSPLNLPTTNRKENRVASSARTKDCKTADRNKDDANAIMEIKKHVDPRAIQDIASPTLLLATLENYNQQEQERVFNSAIFTCKVCFAEKHGLLCICFHGCDHVYCQECMKEYFKVQIMEGNVKCLNCPEQECDSQALPSQVQELVGQELFAKYDRLLLQSSLDGMADIVYCPRSHCQCAVMIEKESNMAVCPACAFAFCTFCKLVYHGVSPCSIRRAELMELREEYENGDDEKRQFLEKRYGRRAIKQSLEESYSEQWLEDNSQACPNCGTHIQKIDGCNKMTCTKCRAYFCWICKSMLSRTNPYIHFNVPDSPCFNLLFQGMGEFVGDQDDEDGWQPRWWFV
ncbi:E3 ubiquitin-protein ligase RNF14-like [Saccoglossus kowalevskii]|uniref:RBR-type E3 ubiquitin transferase n=1 Tax=Saccoglossus kowalevskii TaxID=10224 RepID=A0ABM0MGX7_SACKO|nr:PREDICTED: E3 ubiquitin-protein ligase RNF14-like [Saccoglossus kowalevskii]